MKKDIFVYGGSKDFNVKSILSYIKRNDIKYTNFIHHVGEAIDIVFNLNENELWINGILFDYKYMFIRNDVFANLENPDKHFDSYANNVYTIFLEFALFNHDIKILNRQYLHKHDFSKIFNLLKAQEFGFLIPETLISSNVPKIHNFLTQFECIQKPISGGDFARSITLEQISKYQNDLPMPHKIQRRMLHPEIRIYRIGDVFISFHMEYEGIDYRVKQNAKISKIDNDMSICKKLGALTDFAGLDYAAADFMTDENGELRFLEVNSFPMFGRFDQETDFAISKAIIDFLYA